MTDVLGLFISVVVLCHIGSVVTRRRPNKLSEICRHITLGVARKRQGGNMKIVRDCKVTRWLELAGECSQWRC